jgi:hypothetical protein
MQTTNLMNGIPTPLLMANMVATKIQEDENPEPVMYDPISQTVYDMRLVGTRSLKSSSTRKKVGIKGKITLATDRKNEIDDSKSVK